MSKSVKEATVGKLTDTQQLALSGAARRDDGVIVMPDRVKGQGAKKLANALVEKGLAREVRAKSGMPITRRDEDARPYALVITTRGKSAINIVEGSAEANNVKRTTREAINEQAHDALVGSGDRKAPRAGSKIADVIALLARSEGAGIDDLIAATGWLPHTTRAALTGLRKRGYAVARRKGTKEGGAVYQIEGSPRAEAA